MDTEDAITREFMYGDLSWIDAIACLEAIGLQPKDAERLLDECAELRPTQHEIDRAEALASIGWFGTK